METPRLAWRRLRSWSFAVLAALALGLAALVASSRSRPQLHRLTMTVGPLVDSRALVASELAAAAEASGVMIELVETAGTEVALDRVDDGSIDVAMVPGAIRLDARRRVREVAPLYVEPLHLLVSGPLYDRVSQNLGALSGRRVHVGSAATTASRLATAVLAFAGLQPGDGTAPNSYVPDARDARTLQAQLDHGDPTALPDAVLLLNTLPSITAGRLVREFGYRLVPLPFAEAFALTSLAPVVPATAGDLEREFVYDTVIPAFTYQVEPAVPPAPVRTLGSRAILVANEAVDPEAVTRLLDAVFGTRFAKVTHPHLDPSLLQLPPETALHPGTLTFLARNRPLITADHVDEINNTLGIGGALLGASFFLWQWYRQRTRLRREETFEAYILRAAGIEQRAYELEHAATLELESLLALQREMLGLKREALDRYASGGLEGREVLVDFLRHANDTRDYLGRLILHVRDNLEEAAQAQGRSAQALWNEAAGKPGKPG